MSKVPDREGVGADGHDLELRSVDSADFEDHGIPKGWLGSGGETPFKQIVDDGDGMVAEVGYTSAAASRQRRGRGAGEGEDDSKDECKEGAGIHGSMPVGVGSTVAANAFIGICEFESWGDTQPAYLGMNDEGYRRDEVTMPAVDCPLAVSSPRLSRWELAQKSVMNLIPQALTSNAHRRKATHRRQAKIYPITLNAVQMTGRGASQCYIYSRKRHSLHRTSELIIRVTGRKSQTQGPSTMMLLSQWKWSCASKGLFPT